MDNKQLYKATLCFSVRRILWDILGVLAWAALAVVGFIIADKAGSDAGVIGLIIGALIGLAVLVVLLRWVSYKFKAGQIAMMTKGITEGSLPDDVLGAGNAIVKARFATVAAYFAVTSVIKGIFNQLGTAITKVGEAVGGDTGSTVASVISSVIQVAVRYLCDCCLGWVFYRSEIKSTKATLEGSVLFFKHGKTLAKNLGRVFGMGLASLLLIGGAFTGIFYLIASGFPAVFEDLLREITESGTTLPDWLNSPSGMMLITALIGGVIVWYLIHSSFIRPFVLVGVLRNYILSGVEDIPSEESFSALDSKSEKFKKLHAEAV